MKSADGAAGDGDKGEREHAAGKNGPAAVYEAAQRRHMQCGAHRQNACRQRCDGSQLYERAQIIARRQQHPNRRGRGGEAINYQQRCQHRRAQGEDARGIRRLRNPLAAKYCQHHQHESQKRSLQNFPRPDAPQINAHQQRDGNGHGDGEGPPGARLQRIHHDERGHSQQNHDDAEHRNERHQPADSPDLFFGHLAKRFAIAAHREQQDHKILHAAAKHRPGQDPQGSRQITELRRQHRPHQWPWPGNGGKVVSVNHPLVGRNKIAAVFQPLGRRRPQRIKRQYPRGDKFAVKAVSQGIAAERRRHQPNRVDGFSAAQR